MVTHAAFEQRNPKHLMPIMASMQASIVAIIQQILQTIIADGVKLETPAWAISREVTWCWANTTTSPPANATASWR
ncbi:MAG: hypothetical protein A2045_13240 [Rhodocyclales bacterium GWA2_65_20]|nr:MAG: hypothetical protein A2045_13240 [Rhodocyclales bacterium GWA2_65_20]